MLGPLVIGLTIGLLGGFHCIAMCGPVATYLHGKSGNALSSTLYNMGRISTYVALGLLLGVVGEAIVYSGVQQTISIISGSIIILIILFPRFSKLFSGWSGSSRLVSKLRTKLLQLNERKTLYTYYGLGVLNGLLPCGLVYMALIATLNSGGLFESVLIMGGFGIGTWPLMATILLGGHWLNKQVMIRRFVPSLSVILGILLIIRGLALEIPYLSPAMASLGWDTGITVCQ